MRSHASYLGCILVLAVLALSSTQVNAANAASVAYFTDSACRSPATGVSAQGGLSTDGTCVLMVVGASSASTKYHRLTCGGANGPVYEQFSASDCSGTALYSYKGTATTTDTTCVVGNATSDKTFVGSAFLQCTEVVYKDRIASTYYGIDGSCTNSSKIIGPVYGSIMGTCTDSSDYYKNSIVSTNTYCSPDSSTVLEFSYADNKCTASAWSAIESHRRSGSCEGESRPDSGSWFVRKVCPTGAPAGPAFPPTGNDVSLGYMCDDLATCKTGCRVTSAARLGQCADSTILSTVGSTTSLIVTSTKNTCTQDGANTGTFTYNDQTCQGNVLSTYLRPAGISACRYGVYSTCPSTVADVAQVGGLPAITIAAYDKVDCKSYFGTFFGVAYVPAACSKDGLWSYNTTSVSVKYFQNSNPLYSCNGDPSTSPSAVSGSYPIDVCVNNTNGGGSNQYTTEVSTNANKFKIDVGTATAASTRPPLIGSALSVKLASNVYAINYAKFPGSTLSACIASFVNVSASRLSATAVDITGGSVVTVNFAASSVPTDTTPATAVATIIAANGIFTYKGSQVCADITGLSDGGSVTPTPVVYYGTTLTFSMSFNFSASTAFLTNTAAQTQLTKEIAANAGVDSSRVVYVSSVMDGSKTRVTFTITASTDSTATTPSAAVLILTTKSSTNSLTGTYASAATTDAPQVVPTSLGAASSLAVNAGTFVALALAAIMLILQQ